MDYQNSLAIACLADWYDRHICADNFDDAINQIDGFGFVIENNPLFRVEARAMRTVREAASALNQYAAGNPASQNDEASKVFSALYEFARGQKFPEGLKLLDAMGAVARINPNLEPVAEAARLIQEAHNILSGISERFEGKQRGEKSLPGIIRDAGFDARENSNAYAQTCLLEMHLTRIERQALEYWRKAFQFKGTDGQLAMWILCVAMQHPETLESQMNKFFEACAKAGREQGDCLTDLLSTISRYQNTRLPGTRKGGK